MNKDWAEKNKEIQRLLGKKDTYKEGISKLIEFRNEMFGQITYIVDNYPSEAFYRMPFANVDGYHSKTLSYSIWHIFRIEDIVAHQLIAHDEQVIFSNDYLNKIGADRITTGNELMGEEIVEFSKKLDEKALYHYAKEVMESTNKILTDLEYSDILRKVTEDEKNSVIRGKCVSEDESAFWLVDYWCKKDVRGLIKMPLCKHWDMHIQAMQRIKNKLCKLERKGVDPVAYCGLSCNHCFLGEWCGSCRTEYNACSYALCSPDRKCQNVACCQEKKLDGCYECDELEKCTKGFYTPENDGSKAAKAQAIFIKKYGKKKYMSAMKKLHEKYDFKESQELIGRDVNDGIKLLEAELLQL